MANSFKLLPFSAKQTNARTESKKPAVLRDADQVPLLSFDFVEAYHFNFLAT